MIIALVAALSERTSPGPLSSAHAAVPELEHGAACSVCHVAGAASFASACTSCHPAVAASIRAETGVHGALVEGDVGACGRCHVEHHGLDARASSAIAFRRLGVERVEDFEHRGLGFPLEGRHGGLACEACHPAAHARTLPADGLRFLGLTGNCAACHEDVHQGRMRRECGDCHSADHAFSSVTEYAHADERLNAGAHAALGCTTCHVRGSGYEVEAVWHDADLERRACADCHASEHGAAFLEASAAALGPEADCGACHSTQRDGFGSFAVPDERWHAWTGFALDASHATVACASCHTTAAGARRLDLPTDCAACHATPHAGRLARIGGDCAECHVPTRFDDVGEFDHGRWTGFALDASHADVACAACHTTADGVRRLSGVPTDCSACHATPHEGRLASIGSDCGECHVPTRFDDIDDIGDFEHGHWTGFALMGRHASAACEACHPRAHQPDAMGRSFGRVSRVFGTQVERCSDCHLPAHAGLFERAGGERVDCSRCHDAHGFRPPTSAFDHAQWTGVSLDGAHANVSCEACHHPDPTSSRRLGHATARSCVGCHADAHAGQFVENGVNDCARCHDRTGRTVFDHARQTSFALDGPHADLACNACHQTFDLGASGPVVRYRPLGSECGDCHSPGGGR
ncbi:MAG: hypothetical protein WD226_01350 [Planctomycetota bacterium]